jgi:hypothetical protein
VRRGGADTATCTDLDAGTGTETGIGASIER